MESEYISEIRAFRGFIPKVMGTKLELLVFGISEDGGHALWREIGEDAFLLDSILNRFDPESEVARLNESVPFSGKETGDILRECLRLCLEYKEKTGGIFDITRGQGMLSLDEDGMLSMEGCSMDFGGFAKGYFLKRCKATLEKAGIRDAFVNFGNSTILGMGHHPAGDCWKVDVVDPFSGTAVRTEELRDQTLSTSGNSPLYSGHIINPHDGKAVTGADIVSVVSEDPLEAEIMSTVEFIRASSR